MFSISRFAHNHSQMISNSNMSLALDFGDCASLTVLLDLSIVEIIVGNVDQV